MNDLECLKGSNKKISTLPFSAGRGIRYDKKDGIDY